ncbi:FitA-like ribbon-helix-helix domain-containing protein [Nocardia rhizosphaerae]|uniref:Antitoxin FitA-like ribbon-helix-helix domain-containing protein n=1 Tax=Nocardia rhizosphaerae TaxID=1691571 RepID=A0ABV8L4Q0_9NOCA
MATVQVRDVPDDVAAVIAEKASAHHQSVSAYLRDLMAADVRRELQRRAIAEWNNNLKKTQEELGITGKVTVSSADVVREIRDGYDRGTE